MSTIKGVVGAFLVAAPALALASPVAISQGVLARLNVRDCALSPVGNCIEGDGSSFRRTGVESSDNYRPGEDGAIGRAFNPLAIRNEGITSGSIYVDPGNSDGPVAKVGAFANGAKARTAFSVYGVIGNAWDGSGPAQRALTLALDYTGTNVINGVQPPAAPPLDPFSNLYVYGAIFSLATPTFVVDNDWINGDPNVCFVAFNLTDCLAATRNDFRMEDQLEFGSVPGQTTATGTLHVTLDSNRYFFVVLGAQALAKYNSYMNALNTVTTRFDDTTGFSTLPAGQFPAPEPAGLALLAAALTGIAASRRRRT